ncbi:hypothetical protein DPMN_191026 [Dreissena polymorpha]|uniref:Uncharacterized protein n=1 Tax=Dreissena polymorpha TaxID=45954 RepID=A0A9D4BEL5_DREPO|nr:hypothetical protein DPMN_191026 [Dreissena polymorpha]
MQTSICNKATNGEGQHKGHEIGADVDPRRFNENGTEHSEQTDDKCGKRSKNVA